MPNGGEERGLPGVVIEHVRAEGSRVAGAPGRHLGRRGGGPVLVACPVGSPAL
jgi:hypothetical protein